MKVIKTKTINSVVEFYIHNLSFKGGQYSGGVCIQIKNINGYTIDINSFKKYITLLKDRDILIEDIAYYIWKDIYSNFEKYEIYELEKPITYDLEYIDINPVNVYVDIEKNIKSRVKYITFNSGEPDCVNI